MVTENMGCGTQYKDAESWGLKNQEINGEKRDVAQITVLAVKIIPSNYDKESQEYLAVPFENNAYIELGRITASTPSGDFKISDKDWGYIKNSFRFKE